MESSFAPAQSRLSEPIAQTKSWKEQQSYLVERKRESHFPALNKLRLARPKIVVANDIQGESRNVTTSSITRRILVVRKKYSDESCMTSRETYSTVISFMLFCVFIKVWRSPSIFLNGMVNVRLHECE